MQTKSDIRKEKLTKRVSLSPTEHEALSRKVCDLLEDFLRRQKAERVGTYIPVKREPDIARINQWLVGKSVRGLPAIGESKIMTFREWKNGAVFTANRHGIGELPASAPAFPGDTESSLVILIPCVAFDRKGYRIGYGAGYYDATLAAWREKRKLLAVGVAFNFQEIPTVPVEPHDMRLDAIVTESEYFTIT